MAGLRSKGVVEGVPPPPVPGELKRLEPYLRESVERGLTEVRKLPDSAASWATLGVLYSVNGLWAEAGPCFEVAARLQPSDPLPRMYAAAARVEMGDLLGGAASLDRLVEAFPEFAPGWCRRADLAARRGELATALESYEAVRRLAPGEWRGPAGSGEILFRLGRVSGALPLLEEAIRRAPSEKKAQHLLGEVLRGAGRLEEARIHLALGEGATSSPMPDAWSDQAPAHLRLRQDLFDLATRLAEEGHPDRAVKVLEPLLKHHPEDPTVLNRMAIALIQAGHPAEAIVMLDRVLSVAPAHLPARITHSHALAGLGRFDQALADADLALKTGAPSVEAHLAAANALLGLGRDRDALASVRAAISMDPGNHELRLQAGEILWKNLQVPAEALVEFEEAARLAPVAVAVWVRLTESRARSGDVPGAVRALDRLKLIAPGDPVIKVLERRVASPR